MKKILMIGAALSLWSGVAFADPAPSSPGEAAVTPDSARVTAYSQQSDRGDRWRHARQALDDQGGSGSLDRSDGRRMDRWQHGGSLSKGARVILEHRGNRIDVKCAADDTTQQCVDAVKDLMGTIAATMGGRHGDRSHEGDSHRSPPTDRRDMPDQQDQTPDQPEQ